MVAFIDHHWKTYGVEPICRVLPIAPSTYFRHKAQQADPSRRSARALRDEVLQAIIRRIWTEHHQVYGRARCGGRWGAKGSVSRAVASVGSCGSWASRAPCAAARG